MTILQSAPACLKLYRMTKNQYLSQSKDFLRKLIRTRRWLMEHDKGFVSGKLTQTEIKNIEYALPRLVSATQMKNFLVRKQGVILLLIPTNKQKWYDEFRDLCSFQPTEFKIEFEF